MRRPWSWEVAVRQALSCGYFIGDASARELENGLPRPLRRSLRPDALRPREANDGRRGTFSAMHGLGEFPWHTDGAIADRPPRFVLLQSATESRTPTELLRITNDSPYLAPLLKTVLFTRYVQPRYLRAADRVGGCLRVRWDPDKLSVASPGAIGLPNAQTSPDAYIDWRPGTVALIDNWQCLHRRPRLAQGDLKRVLIRTYVHEGLDDV